LASFVKNFHDESRSLAPYIHLKNKNKIKIKHDPSSDTATSLFVIIFLKVELALTFEEIIAYQDAHSYRVNGPWPIMY